MAIRKPELLSKTRPREYIDDPVKKIYYDNIEAYLRQIARKVGEDDDDIPITDDNLTAISNLSPDLNLIIIGDGETFTGTTVGSLAFQDTIGPDEFIGVLPPEKGGADSTNSISEAAVMARVSLRV